MTLKNVGILIVRYSLYCQDAGEMQLDSPMGFWKKYAKYFLELPYKKEQISGVECVNTLISI